MRSPTISAKFDSCCGTAELGSITLVSAIPLGTNYRYHSPPKGAHRYLSSLVVLARALVGVKSEEPCSAVVMLEYDGLESVTRQKRTRVLLLE